MSEPLTYRFIASRTRTYTNTLVYTFIALLFGCSFLFFGGANFIALFLPYSVTQFDIEPNLAKNIVAVLFSSIIVVFITLVYCLHIYMQYLKPIQELDIKITNKFGTYFRSRYGITSYFYKLISAEGKIYNVDSVIFFATELNDTAHIRVRNRDILEITLNKNTPYVPLSNAAQEEQKRNFRYSI